ncbi:MAG: hypothetical protein IKG42_01905 [Clostridia bacterium]|nr:hypothetical protein [Clostridia bacterium]
MKFIKGAILGSMITAGAIMMYGPKEMDHAKKKIMKKGKQMVSGMMNW